MNIEKMAHVYYDPTEDTIPKRKPKKINKKVVSKRH